MGGGTARFKGRPAEEGSLTLGRGSGLGLGLGCASSLQYEVDEVVDDEANDEEAHYEVVVVVVHREMKCAKERVYS